MQQQYSRVLNYIFLLLMVLFLGIAIHGCGGGSGGGDDEENSNSAPTTPGTITVSNITTNSAQVCWETSSDPDGDPITYEVEYGKDNTPGWTSAGTTLSTCITLSGLASDTTYVVRVKALDDNSGLSDWNEQDPTFTTLETNTSENEVWTWGNNWYGQLGDGTTNNSSSTPIQVKGLGGVEFLTNITAIAGGLVHTVAIKGDGTVWAWGWNNYGQLGDGTIENRSTPVQVVGSGGTGVLTNITAIAGGGAHTIALRNDGTVWAWGNNEDDQLGDGTTNNSSTPVQVVGPGGTGVLTNITAIAVGEFHTIALKDDGTVWAWGRNGDGQLGSGATDFVMNSPTPIQIKGPGDTGFLTNITAIAGGYGHTSALKDDGTVWAWGDNGDGQLGDGTTNRSLTPVQVRSPSGMEFLSNITAIASGEYHTIALKDDGTIWAWGSNRWGQLGDGTIECRSTPVQVVGPGGTGFLSSITAIAGGWSHTIALKGDGTVWAWGDNDAGQLGDGTTAGDSPIPTPVQVKGPDGTGFLNGITAIAGGGYHTIAIGE